MKFPRITAAAAVVASVLLVAGCSDTTHTVAVTTSPSDTQSSASLPLPTDSTSAAATTYSAPSTSAELPTPTASGTPSTATRTTSAAAPANYQGYCQFPGPADYKQYALASAPDITVFTAAQNKQQETLYWIDPGFVIRDAKGALNPVEQRTSYVGALYPARDSDNKSLPATSEYAAKGPFQAYIQVAYQGQWIALQDFKNNTRGAYTAQQTSSWQSFESTWRALVLAGSSVPTCP